MSSLARFIFNTVRNSHPMTPKKNGGVFIRIILVCSLFVQGWGTNLVFAQQSGEARECRSIVADDSTSVDLTTSASAQTIDQQKSQTNKRESTDTDLALGAQPTSSEISNEKIQETFKNWESGKKPVAFDEAIDFILEILKGKAREEFSERVAAFRNKNVVIDEVKHHWWTLPTHVFNKKKYGVWAFGFGPTQFILHWPLKYAHSKNDVLERLIRVVQMLYEPELIELETGVWRTLRRGPVISEEFLEAVSDSMETQVHLYRELNREGLHIKIEPDQKGELLLKSARRVLFALAGSFSRVAFRDINIQRWATLRKGQLGLDHAAVKERFRWEYRFLWTIEQVQLASRLITASILSAMAVHLSMGVYHNQATGNETMSATQISRMLEYEDLARQSPKNFFKKIDGDLRKMDKFEFTPEQRVFLQQAKKLSQDFAKPSWPQAEIEELHLKKNINKP